MRKTRSSRSISSVIAARRASRYCITAIGSGLLRDEGGDRDVLVERLDRRLGRLLGELDRLLDLLLDLLVHVVELLLGDPAALLEDRLVDDDRVALPGLV